MSKVAVVEKQFEYKGHDCICEVVKGKRKTTGGYIWQHAK